jgi:lysozyme
MLRRERGLLPHEVQALEARGEEVIQGIDVSAAQGVVSVADWATMKRQGIRFAFVKCGNGNDPTDGAFVRNIDNARAGGLIVGAYHVLFPLNPSPAHPGREPDVQARMHYFASRDRCMPGDLPTVLDFELPTPDKWGTPPGWMVDAESIADCGLAYLQEYEQLSGKRPMIYTFPWFWKAVAKVDVSAFADYRLWLARYKAPAAGTLAPWTSPTFWQYSDGGGRLPNGAPVDQNCFMGDEAAFASLLAE